MAWWGEGVLGCEAGLNGAGPAGWLRESGDGLPRSKAFGWLVRRVAGSRGTALLSESRREAWWNLVGWGRGARDRARCACTWVRDRYEQHTRKQHGGRTPPRLARTSDGQAASAPEGAIPWNQTAHLDDAAFFRSGSEIVCIHLSALVLSPCCRQSWAISTAASSAARPLSCVAAYLDASSGATPSQ